MNHLHSVLSKFPMSFARACADDIGVAASQSNSLPKLANTFEYFECISNLKLGTPKCVIIPLKGPCTSETLQAYRSELEHRTP